MVEVKTIKDVEERTWSKFKSLAARNNMKLGAFFEIVIDDYDSHCKKFWNEVLNMGKMISDKEAEERIKILKESRKEYGFRI